MSDYVLKILDHYKQEDPVGIPGAPIPDPLPVPDLSHSFSVGNMKMRNVKLYGLTNFRINQVKANIAVMTVESSLNLELLSTRGNYTLSALFSSSKGPFTVNLTDVFVQANATLQVQKNGKLEAQDMSMDVSYGKLDMDFKGLGSFYQNVVKAMGDFVFQSIKPYVMKEMNVNMRQNVNEQIQKLNQTFPNSISPFDELVSEARHRIRESGFDPYQVKDYSNPMGIFEIRLSNTWVFGLSSVYRHGDIVFEIRNKTIYMIVDVGTQRLKGVSNWEVTLISGIMSRAGTVSFTVEYVRVSNVSY